ncbi:MAG TPA: hypothetical protein VLB44_08855 [Kofleriaceae bacterium]|nr:hypothetical protein [Kofleriaceae bacterium]
MRIPPSVIVMGLLTAVPFGLAIRDTAKHQAASADGIDLTGSKKAERERLAAYQRAEREQEAREAEAKNRREQFVASLFGKTPASMGSFLEGITLGANAETFQPDATQKRIYEAARSGLANVEFATEDILHAVKVEVRAVDCDTLRDKLTAAWGRSVGSVWLDPATHQRASLAEYEESGFYCKMQFDRYVEPDAWVGALPFDAIGKPIAALGAPAGAKTEDDSVSWRLPGLGYGHQETVVIAYIENDKVVGANVITDADFDSQLKIRDLLSAKLAKQPVQDENDSGVWIWKTKLPVKLDGSGAARFSVQIGKQTWQ